MVSFDIKSAINVHDVSMLYYIYLYIYLYWHILLLIQYWTNFFYIKFTCSFHILTVIDCYDKQIV